MILAALFVEKVKIPLAQGWGYIWGTYGQVWTAAKQKKATRAQTKKYGAKWIGKTVCDCSGLVRWALLQFGISVPHSSSLQHGLCKVHGKLVAGVRDDGKPIKPGTLVFLNDGSKVKPWHHVGVYVGGGVCIESKGTKYGVVTSPLSHWDDWGELNCIDYSGEEGDTPMPVKATLRRGAQGEEVRIAQEKLIELGYLSTTPGADGKFGQQTENAVKSLQKDNGLAVDGVIGAMTWEVLEKERDVKRYNVLIKYLTSVQVEALKNTYQDLEIINV